MRITEHFHHRVAVDWQYQEPQQNPLESRRKNSAMQDYKDKGPPPFATANES